ncbi:MAG: LytTR family DNA-binding domain-containing protein [Chitinophagaceae bacterium]|jgi:DNA-binding LytR/AlgR family response regulator|nr:LytTR family DNA-binding domain-containing protein [Chitinophagaceae bacterium]
MKAIAIDDEPLALGIIKAHAQKVPYLELTHTFSNAFEALAWLQQNETDLLFLDIKMPDVSGLEFYGSLHRKPMVIFTTAYAEHAVSGFELDAVDYLMKPISLTRFLKACNKALELFNYRTVGDVKNNNYIIVKSGVEQIKINFDEILYLEATGNYVSFIMNNRKILSRSTFAEALQLLPESLFMRIHRSYVVNLKKIEKADKTQVFIQGQSLPLSEAFNKAFFDRWK